MVIVSSILRGLRDTSGSSAEVVSAEGRSTGCVGEQKPCSTFSWHSGKGAKQCQTREGDLGKLCLLFTGGEQQMQLNKKK